MKRFLAIMTVLFATMFANAQGNIKNNSYFNLGWNKPMSGYGVEKCSPTTSLHDVYMNSTATDATRLAGEVQLGANFYISPVTWLIKWFKIGVTADFIDLNANYYKFDPIIDGHRGNFDLLVTYNFSVGPIVTVSPAKDFYIDVYGKLVPTAGINYMKLADGDGILENKQLISNNTSPNYNDEENCFVYGLNYAAGVGLRYKLVQVGAEWNFGHMTYDFENWNKQKFGNNHLRVKFGFFFD